MTQANKLPHAGIARIHPVAAQILTSLNLNSTDVGSALTLIALLLERPDFWQVSVVTRYDERTGKPALVEWQTKSPWNGRLTFSSFEAPWITRDCPLAQALCAWLAAPRYFVRGNRHYSVHRAGGLDERDAIVFQRLLEERE